MPYVFNQVIINRPAVRAAATLLIVLTLWAPISVAGAAGKPVTILVLGDSLTAGYGLAREQAFPFRLGQALAARGIEAKVVNSGISGDTTAGGRARLGWVLAAKPDYVIVELGGNDGLRGLEPAQTRANLEAIVVRLKAEKVPVLLAGMLAPPNLGPQYGSEFNAIYPALAKKHGVLLYAFFLDGVAAQRRLNQRDGIHPNAKGVDVIVGRILPYVIKLIGAKAATAQK